MKTLWISCVCNVHPAPYQPLIFFWGRDINYNSNFFRIFVKISQKKAFFWKYFWDMFLDLSLFCKRKNKHSAIWLVSSCIKFQTKWIFHGKVLTKKPIFWKWPSAILRNTIKWNFFIFWSIILTELWSSSQLGCMVWTPLRVNALPYLAQSAS